MATTLSPSSLKYCDPGEVGWRAHWEDNWERLNGTLLKLSALLDVDPTGLVDGDVLVYKTTTSKWECETSPGGFRQLTTTTTTV